MNKRGDIKWDKLIGWAVVAILFVLSVIIILLLRDTGTGIIGSIRDFFRFGR